MLKECVIIDTVSQEGIHQRILFLMALLTLSSVQASHLQQHHITAIICFHFLYLALYTSQCLSRSMGEVASICREGRCMLTKNTGLPPSLLVVLCYYGFLHFQSHMYSLAQTEDEKLVIFFRNLFFFSAHFFQSAFPV